MASSACLPPNASADQAVAQLSTMDFRAASSSWSSRSSPSRSSDWSARVKEDGTQADRNDVPLIGVEHAASATWLRWRATPRHAPTMPALIASSRHALPSCAGKEEKRH